MLVSTPPFLFFSFKSSSSDNSTFVPNILLLLTLNFLIVFILLSTSSCAFASYLITNKYLLVRRINISFNNLTNEKQIDNNIIYEQYNLFTDYKKRELEKQKQKEEEMKERELQSIIIDIKNKYGKNSILKGMNYIKGGRTIERNMQIGGHKE